MRRLAAGCAGLALALAALLQAPAPAAEGPRYWKGSELDTRPAALSEIEPVPPKSAGNRPGKVVARVLINEAGTADRVQIESSEPKGLFDKAVISAFGAARYRPGTKHGISVKSQMRVEVLFHRLPASAAKAPAAR